MVTGQATTAAQRRREILDAAGALLEERSWDGFAMRDVAMRAGLSAGAVYQYFSGKQDIFAALYAERLAAELDALTALAGADLDAVADHVVRAFAEIYGRFGRHQLAWAAEGFDQTDSVAHLGAVFHALAQSLESTLEAAANRSGRTLVPGVARMPMLWALVNGVGDQLVDDRQRLHGATRDDLLGFAAQALVAALTRPVAPDAS